MKTKQEQIKAIKQIIDERVETTLGYVQGRHGNVIKTVDTVIIARDIVEAGYGDVSEYKAEIERLKDEFKQLETNAEILAMGVRDLNHENYELTEKIKQAQIDVLNKVKNYIDDKIENDYGDMSDSVNYLTIDIDDFDDFIDELIREVQNGKDKG